MRKQSDSETLEQLYDLHEQKMYAVAASFTGVNASLPLLSFVNKRLLP